MNLSGHQACTWFTHTQAGTENKIKPFKGRWEVSLFCLFHLVSLSRELWWMRSAVWNCLYVTIIVFQDDYGTQRLRFPNVHVTVRPQALSPIDLLENDWFPAATVCHEASSLLSMICVPSEKLIWASWGLTPWSLSSCGVLCTFSGGLAPQRALHLGWTGPAGSR